MTTQTIEAIRNNLDDDNTLSRPNIEFLLSEIDSLRSQLARVQAGEVGALIARWRNSSTLTEDPEYATIVDSTKQGCADELEAALTAAQPQAAPAELGAAKE